MSKVVFFGGKSIGYGVLQHLLSTDKVVGIFTNPSDSHPTWFPSLYPLVEKSGVSFYSQEKPRMEEIKEMNPDWLVCAYYDRIIPDDILSLARSVNVHMGLIQEYRGCYPTTFPIIDGKDHAGVTMHEITKEVDGGKVYAQATVSIDPKDTGETLYYKCTGAGISLFKDTWELINSGIIKPREVKICPDYHDRKSFPSLDIPKEWDEEKKDRYIRALDFPPFPPGRII